MLIEKRLPKFIRECPVKEYGVLDLREYPWGYMDSDGFLYVGIKTNDLYDFQNVTFFDAYRYRSTSFESCTENEVVELVADKLFVVFTPEDYNGLTPAQLKECDANDGVVRGETFILLFSAKHHGFQNSIGPRTILK